MAEPTDGFGEIAFDAEPVFVTSGEVQRRVDVAERGGFAIPVGGFSRRFFDANPELASETERVGRLRVSSVRVAFCGGLAEPTNGFDGVFFDADAVVIANAEVI